MKTTTSDCSSTPGRVVGIALAAISLTAAQVAVAELPARGIIEPYEINYLKSIIDHHYSALRITELAAGTDLNRDAPISPEEGTSPTPDTAATQAKSQTDEIKSLARRNNRMQREEIMMAQGFLRDWYQIEYSPRLDKMSKAQIASLENAAAGAEFDRLFLRVLSRHHEMAIENSAPCMVSVDLEHDELQRYCEGIVEAQKNDILEMRQLLCENFSICDYQPLGGIKGRSSGKDDWQNGGKPGKDRGWQVKR